MLTLIRNHIFVIIFFILSMAMGLLFIFNLSEEEGSGNILGKQENILIDQQKSSQRNILEDEQVLE